MSTHVMTVSKSDNPTEMLLFAGFTQDSDTPTSFTRDHIQAIVDGNTVTLVDLAGVLTSEDLEYEAYAIRERYQDALDAILAKLIVMVAEGKMKP